MRSIVQDDELPAIFNDAISNSGAMVSLGSMAPRDEWANTTLDYQINRFGISGSQLQMAINGTIFNNRSTGYRVLDVPLPTTMPFHDPDL